MTVEKAKKIKEYCFRRAISFLVLSAVCPIIIFISTQLFHNNNAFSSLKSLTIISIVLCVILSIVWLASKLYLDKHEKQDQ
ncbi:putative membrane protein [Clostridiales Family XIII bacterium PM5-7]